MSASNSSAIIYVSHALSMAAKAEQVIAKFNELVESLISSGVENCCLYALYEKPYAVNEKPLPPAQIRRLESGDFKPHPVGRLAGESANLGSAILAASAKIVEQEGNLTAYFLVDNNSDCEVDVAASIAQNAQSKGGAFLIYAFSGDQDCSTTLKALSESMEVKKV